MNRRRTLTLTPATKKALLEEVRAALQPGDILLFYHRTSWRSRVIRRITRCGMPHMCVYQGRQRIVGMLKGRVRHHRVGRFFKNEYDLRIVRGSPGVLGAIEAYLGRREAVGDLLVLWSLLLVSRVLGRDARDVLHYGMRGVTCSGVVSAAVHAAYGLEPIHPPLADTPRDVEEIIRRLQLRTLFDLSFVPEAAGP